MYISSSGRNELVVRFLQIAGSQRPGFKPPVSCAPSGGPPGGPSRCASVFSSVRWDNNITFFIRLCSDYVPVHGGGCRMLISFPGV